MKTIEITSGDQKAQFTTKSVTFDGKEFFYAKMTNVINSTEKHVYSFTYDGEIKLLPYEEKDAGTLNAIFSQVQKLAAQKRAASAASVPSPAPGAAAQSAQESGSAEPTGNNQAPEAKAEKASASEQEKSGAASVSVSDVMGGASKGKTAALMKEKKEADAESKAKPDGGAKTESKEMPEVSPEIKARRKKSLTIFAILLAVVLVCSVIYYFVFGTPSDPTPANPNASESQQYDDIDQLIDDLQ